MSNTKKKKAKRDLSPTHIRFQGDAGAWEALVQEYMPERDPADVTPVGLASAMHAEITSLREQLRGSQWDLRQQKATTKRAEQAMDEAAALLREQRARADMERGVVAVLQGQLEHMRLAAVADRERLEERRTTETQRERDEQRELQRLRRELDAATAKLAQQQEAHATAELKHLQQLHQANQRTERHDARNRHEMKRMADEHQQVVARYTNQAAFYGQIVAQRLVHAHQAASHAIEAALARLGDRATPEDHFALQSVLGALQLTAVGNSGTNGALTLPVTVVSVRRSPTASPPQQPQPQQQQDVHLGDDDGDDDDLPHIDTASLRSGTYDPTASPAYYMPSE